MLAFSGSRKNDCVSGIVVPRLNSNSADRERRLVVADRIPIHAVGVGGSGVGRPPDSSLCAFDKNCVARRIGRIDHDRCRSPCDLVIILRAVPACIRGKRHGTERNPRTSRKRSLAGRLGKGRGTLLTQSHFALVSPPTEFCPWQSLDNASTIEPFVAFLYVVAVGIRNWNLRVDFLRTLASCER